MLIYFTCIVLINIIGMTLGAFFTQNARFALPALWKKLDRKPFNCKPCLTFHFLWMLYASASLVLHSFVFFVIGCIFSLAIFGILYLENKNKISN